jgi:hypothetical protein
MSGVSNVGDGAIPTPLTGGYHIYCLEVRKKGHQLMSRTFYNSYDLAFTAYCKAKDNGYSTITDLLIYPVWVVAGES